MIKINLIPKREIKTKIKKKVDITLSKDVVRNLLIPVFILLIILGLIFAYLEMTKSNLKREIEQNKNLLSNLQKKVEEVKKFEALNKEIEAKTKVIEDLRKIQVLPVTLLNLIPKKLPDGVWLTALNYDNNAVTIEGFSFSNLNIVTFVENLKAVSELQDVALVESSQAEYEKTTVYKFILRFKVKN